MPPRPTPRRTLPAMRIVWLTSTALCGGCLAGMPLRMQVERQVAARLQAARDAARGA